MSGAVVLEILGKTQADWIERFTGGAVVPAQSVVKPEDELDGDDELAKAMRRLQILQDKDSAKELAHKEQLLEAALKKIAAMETELREASAIGFERKGNKQLEKLRPEDRDQAGDGAFEVGGSHEGVKKAVDAKGKTIEKVTPVPKGRRMINSQEDQALQPGQKADDVEGEKHKLQKTIDTLAVLDELVRTDLALQTWERWDIPAGAKPPFTPVKVKGKLFTEAEIAEEIYTPLVRDGVIGETTVPAKFSKTQKMLDGSDDYYIKECKEKGKAADSGYAALAKGGIALGVSIAGTITGGLTAPKEGSGQIGNAADPLSKGEANKINTITAGVGAILTGLVDLADKADTWKKGGEITASDVIGTLNNMGQGMVSAILGPKLDPNATDDSAAERIAAIKTLVDLGSNCTQVGAEWVKWFNGGRLGPPPWDYTISAVGNIIGDVMSYQSDTISAQSVYDPNNLLNAKADTLNPQQLQEQALLMKQQDAYNKQAEDVDDAYSAAGSAVAAAFPVFASAVKNQVFANLRKGDKTAAFNLLIAAGARAGNAYLQIAVSNDQGNTASTDSSYTGVASNQTDGNTATESLIATAGKLTKKVDRKFKKSKDEKDALLKKQADAVKKEAEKFAKEMAVKEQNSIKPEDIVQELEKQQKEFKDSLVRLGRDRPEKDEDFKSIANLIAQIEADRAIWDAVTSLFGSGISAANAVTETVTNIASEVVPALAAAGQAVKFVTNIKAAMDRLEAFMQWQESQAEAVTAASPYATSIQRFVSSQKMQKNHYYIQAGANAINVVLKLGGMTPLAPAFKAASGAVTALSTLESTLYSFRKQRQLAAAWAKTKEAIDPRNKGNRKLRLIARKMNPTLAKYTIAYGAVVEEDSVAIAAMDRIGVDRETLVNSAGAVKDVKKYLETLYPEDGSVYVTLDAAGPPGFKAPPPELKPKTWALTSAAMRSKTPMDKDPPQITGNLSLFAKLAAELANQEQLLLADETGDPKLVQKKRDLQQEQLGVAKALEAAFRSFRPTDIEGKPVDAARAAILVYADLAGAEVLRIDAEMEPEDEDERMGRASLRQARRGGNTVAATVAEDKGKQEKEEELEKVN